MPAGPAMDDEPHPKRLRGTTEGLITSYQSICLGVEHVYVTESEIWVHSFVSKENNTRGMFIALYSCSTHVIIIINL